MTTRTVHLRLAFADALTLVRLARRGVRCVRDADLLEHFLAQLEQETQRAPT